MPKTRIQKQETLNELENNLAQAKAIVFADVQGLKARDLVVLRRKLREAKGIFKIAKKTLIDLALKNSGDREAAASPAVSAREMQGEVAVLFGLEDPILPLKSLYNFAKEHESLKFIAGIFDNALLDKEEVLALAQLPSKEELLAKLVGSLASPLSGLLNTFQGNIKGLITVLAKAKT